MDRQLHHRLNAGEADDACMIGEDPRTGFRVVIGQQKVAARRELSGKAVIWITPDEVAAVLANLEAFKPIAVVKTLFPGAEILDVRRGGRRGTYEARSSAGNEHASGNLGANKSKKSNGD